MDDIRPLPYFGIPTDAQREALRAGKELLGVDWFIRPIEAKPGVVGRVLAFQEPNFIIMDGYVLLTKPPTPERMAAALREVFGLTAGDYLIRPEHQLSKWLGAEVKFLGVEEE
jgi:hypothetical protein